MLYTGKGDGGTTTTFGCNQQRISKTAELPEALGALDELNAWLGFVKMRAAHLQNIKHTLRNVQEALFIIQAEVAGADKTITQEKVEEIERLIAAIESVIEPIRSFSIAGGTALSALLDVARTLARRVERRVLRAAEQGGCNPSIATRAYLNRLSSLLFALARLANHEAGVAEEHPSYK